MKKVSLFALGLFVMTACNSGNPTENTNEETAIGGETDDKGCLVAAGESWSELQQGCVQIFDIGTRLDPVVETDGEAIISAFVLYNEDQSKIEVFLPQTDHTIILDKVEADVFQNESLTYQVKESALYIDGTKSYEVKSE